MTALNTALQCPCVSLQNFAICETNDVRLLAKAATAAVNRIYRPGFKYSKVEVLLMDLRQPGEFTDDFFAESQPQAAEKVMGVLDEINQRWAERLFAPVVCRLHLIGECGGR